MSGFDRDDFGAKILSMYSEAKSNNYILKLDEEHVDELKSIYEETHIPKDKIQVYTDDEITKKMMTAIVSVYKQDKECNGGSGDIIQLVNTVRYDGRNMYLEYARISPIRMRRFQLDKSRQDLADKIGYGVAAVRNCESPYCDLERQPQSLVEKLADALECSPEELY
jgi:hypothetical protein